MNNTFKAGQIITFSVVPPASYLRVGEQYRVESVSKRDVSFRNVVRGSGTFDSLTQLTRFSKFEVSA